MTMFCKLNSHPIAESFQIVFALERTHGQHEQDTTDLCFDLSEQLLEGVVGHPEVKAGIQPAGCDHGVPVQDVGLTGMANILKKIIL